MIIQLYIAFVCNIIYHSPVSFTQWRFISGFSLSCWTSPYLVLILQSFTGGHDERETGVWALEWAPSHFGGGRVTSWNYRYPFDASSRDPGRFAQACGIPLFSNASRAAWFLNFCQIATVFLLCPLYRMSRMIFSKSSSWENLLCSMARSMRKGQICLALYPPSTTASAWREPRHGGRLSESSGQ